jgi:hypothetical protein
MTALERLNARPGPIHPSRRRAPARTAKVRSNSDTSPQDASDDAERACISLRSRRPCRRNRHPHPDKPSGAH